MPSRRRPTERGPCLRDPRGPFRLVSGPAHPFTHSCMSPTFRFPFTFLFYFTVLPNRGFSIRCINLLLLHINSVPTALLSAPGCPAEQVSLTEVQAKQSAARLQWPEDLGGAGRGRGCTSAAQCLLPRRPSPAGRARSELLANKASESGKWPRLGQQPPSRAGNWDKTLGFNT